MNLYKRQVCAGLWLFLVLHPLPVCAEAHTVKWFVDWRSPDGRLQGQALSLLEDTAHDFTALDLLEAPNGRRLLLRQYILGPEGLTATRIQDDASGWWVELKWDVRLSFKDLRD